MTIKGAKELEAAIKRNPRAVLRETRKYFVRGLAVYSSIIGQNPWRKGMQGGGAPLDTGYLRDTHAREVKPFSATIRPIVSYAPYVHGIEGHPRKRTYQLRPWLTYAVEQGQQRIAALQDDLLKNIVTDLAT